MPRLRCARCGVSHPLLPAFTLAWRLDAAETIGSVVDLRRAREQELSQAGVELGAASVTLLDYPDGRLSLVPPAELAAHAAAAAALGKAGGLLVFDDTGIIGHPDHRAAAAVLAGQHAGLPVLAWALPRAVAGQLKAETGHDFAARDYAGPSARTRVSIAVRSPSGARTGRMTCSARRMARPSSSAVTAAGV